MSGPNGAFFVTGTDTGIGKTYISRLLADCFAIDVETTYMKPVQTGCSATLDGELRAPDFDFVMEGSARITSDYGSHVPYRFVPACSPHLAASLEGRSISLDTIREAFFRVRDGAQVVIVEGAGGLLSPLSETSFMADLIKHLQLPAVVVTSPRLGTLNHTFLTLRVLAQQGIPLAGVVFNAHEAFDRDFIFQDNCRMIREHVYPTPFLEVSHGSLSDDTVREFCRSLERFF